MLTERIIKNKIIKKKLLKGFEMKQSLKKTFQNWKTLKFFLTH